MLDKKKPAMKSAEDSPLPQQTMQDGHTSTILFVIVVKDYFMCRGGRTKRFKIMH